MDCKRAQEKLRAARRAKRVGEAWDISNTMRAHGCPVSLDGLKGAKRRGRRTTCTVRWSKGTHSGWMAVLYDSAGHSINSAYGWKHKPAASTRARVAAKLQRGCAELSRR